MRRDCCLITPASSRPMAMPPTRTWPIGMAPRSPLRIAGRICGGGSSRSRRKPRHRWLTRRSGASPRSTRSRLAFAASADERRAVRQERTRPLVEDLKAWFEALLARISGKSVLAEAIRYGLNQWDGLVRFLDDGRIEMDTNTVERAMRPIVLNRKNALFAGHDLGAENWAVIASLIETCKLHSMNPEAYLADVLTRLVGGWPNRRLAELTPWAWAQSLALPMARVA